MGESRPAPRTRPAGRGRRHAIALLVALVLVSAGAWLLFRLPIALDARAARAAVAAGRFEDAEGPLERWIQARPGDAEAWFLKGQVAAARRRPQEAIECLARARSLGYDEVPTARLAGLLLARAGRAAEAEPLLRRALDASATPEPEVARELARIYLESYRLEPAAAVIERWARDAPRDPAPYLWQVEVDRRLPAAPEVLVAHYREALERDPDLDQARLGMADALREAHRNEEARAAYTAFLASHPDDPAALLGLGITADAQGDDDGAVAYLRRASEQAPEDHRPRAELAAVAMRRSELAEALSWLDEAVRLAPRDYELRYRRGLVLARMGRHEQAEAEREHADRLRAEQDRIQDLHARLARSPGDVDLRHEVASWLMANGHEEEGLRWAELVVRERPDHAPTNRLLADYYDRLGQSGLANYYRLHASPPRRPESGPRQPRRRTRRSVRPAFRSASRGRRGNPPSIPGIPEILRVWI